MNESIHIGLKRLVGDEEEDYVVIIRFKNGVVVETVLTPPPIGVPGSVFDVLYTGWLNEEEAQEAIKQLDCIAQLLKECETVFMLKSVDGKIVWM